MSGAAIHIRLDDHVVIQALAQAAARAADLTPLLDNIGASLVTSTQMRFEREQGPDGQAWPPSIRALIEGGKTLRDHNQLYGSITHVASANGVEVGSNVLYAAVHQFGATIEAKNAKTLKFKVGGRYVSKERVTIPARPFLGIDDGDRAMIAETVSEWLEALP
ncbi:phage virion morphogenesis protein [Dongia sp.]|uniref:phage virion morphogenesis protein n=1 Tax=Dongia sp. TaxID=1977262 RepID=UPI0035B32B45